MLSHLIAIEPLANSERIIKAIRNRETFFSAIFEAYVAFVYSSKGYEVEIIEERPRMSQKTCDLRINVKGKPIYIECKHLEDFSLKETPEWNNLFWRIHKILSKFMRNWHILIYSSKQIDHEDANHIYSECLSNIRKDDFETKTTRNGKFKIEFLKISEFDQIIEGSMQLNLNSNMQLLSIEIKTNVVNGKVIAKNPRIISVAPYFEGDISPRLISEFKKARKQIPREGPSIIHFAIPYKQGPRLLDVMDKLYSHIYGKLNRDTERVNAIVITGETIDTKSQKPVNYLHYIIPNLRTRLELPSSFSILGTNDQGIPLVDKNGQIEVGFRFYKEFMESNPSSYVIFDHSTGDGKYQLKIWHTWSGRIRFELFTPSIGRICSDSDLIKLDKKERHIFAARWSENKIDLFLDDCPIGQN